MQGLTYADFTAKADGGGQLSFTVGYPLFGEGNLDGIQLEHIDSSVPEPGTFVISSIVIVTFGALRLRTRLKRAN